MTQNYVNPFTGQTVSPSTVSYEALTISTSTTLEWPINGNDATPAAAIIDVDATVTGLQLILPPATQVSTGQSMLIRNIGANSFTVTDNTGGTVCVVASGVAECVFLTDNSTVAGAWASITFGAGTSSAQAAALAGYGLLAINQTLNQAYKVVTVYSGYTFLPSDRASFFVWESGVGNLTLPSSAAVGNNWFVMIRNNGTGILTLVPSGTDTIDGNSTQQLQLTESLVLVSNGTGGYNTFGYGRSNTFFYTQLVKVVTGGTYTLTAAEAGNFVQEYQGTLTSNQTIVLPPTVQVYSVNNQTSGAYTLTFTTGAVGGSTFTLPQGNTALITCNGTDVYSATTAAVITNATLTLANGSSGAPSLNFVGDSLTGLYLQATSQLGFAVAGANAATLTTTGLLVPVGIPGGSF